MKKIGLRCNPLTLIARKLSLEFIFYPYSFASRGKTEIVCYAKTVAENELQFISLKITKLWRYIYFDIAM